MGKAKTSTVAAGSAALDEADATEPRVRPTTDTLLKCAYYLTGIMMRGGCIGDRDCEMLDIAVEHILESVENTTAPTDSERT